MIETYEHPYHEIQSGVDRATTHEKAFNVEAVCLNIASKTVPCIVRRTTEDLSLRIDSRGFESTNHSKTTARSIATIKIKAKAATHTSSRLNCRIGKMR